MAIKKVGAAVCTIALLAGCMTGTEATDQFSNRVVQATSQDEITISGRAVPYQEVLVSPKINGKIKAIKAELGAYVKEGQVLAELDEGDLAEQVKRAEDQVKVVEAQGNLQAMEQQIALNQTMASLNQAMVSLNMAPPEAPVLPQLAGFPELEAAKVAVQDAELALTEIIEELQATTELFNNGLVSKQELDQVTATKDRAEIELERAKKKVETETVKANIQQKYEEEKKKFEAEKKQYENARAKYDQDANQAAQQTEISARDTLEMQKKSAEVTAKMTQIAIENAKSELEAIRNQYNNLPIVAPFNGFITESSGRIGEMIGAGEPLFVITNLDRLYITIEVSESMINRWKENQSVEVLFPTQELTVKGTVAYVGLVPSGEGQTYPVKVLVENTGHKIRAGMKAVVTLREELKSAEAQS
ncbi:HlyD family secretion protein [Bacillus dakarensis]|uniref:HlyD family secretion protein n=1 Tax=Robertmurraya dakarensis TaxID=1926278 RepID=UPI000981058C|nr:efflux RND transporter periplasmic adaptor subunit [Bacillus dakarensis]